MATQEPGAREQSALTPLPRVEDLPVSAQGYDQGRVQDAFEAFRRHVTQLQAQLRVVQAASARGEPTGHAVRMDSLHLVRAAAELADTIERDAQEAATSQIGRAESVIGERRRELVKYETQLEQRNRELEQHRKELLEAAGKEAEETRARAQREAEAQLSAARKEAEEATSTAQRQAEAKTREAEAAAARLLEQARHQATELTNSARAEIDRSLEWARGEAGEIQKRARGAAEQLLGAAGLKAAQLNKVIEAVVGELRKTEDAGNSEGGGSEGTSGS